MSMPWGVFMFREMDSLPAFQLWRWPSPGQWRTPGRDDRQRVVDSDLDHLAPWSERIRVAEGPAWIQVKSSTRMPSRARPVGCALPFKSIQPQAVSRSTSSGEEPQNPA